MTEKMLNGKMVTWLLSSAIFCINRKRDEKSKKIEDLLAVIEDLKVKFCCQQFPGLFLSAYISMLVLLFSLNFLNLCQELRVMSGIYYENKLFVS